MKSLLTVSGVVFAHICVFLLLVNGCRGPVSEPDTTWKGDTSVYSGGARSAAQPARAVPASAEPAAVPASSAPASGRPVSAQPAPAETKPAATSPAAAESSAVTIHSEDPSRLMEALQLGRRTMDLVQQNFMATILVNSGAMLLGALGKINPLWAAVIHNTATLAVVLNSCRILRPQRKSRLRRRAA